MTTEHHFAQVAILFRMKYQKFTILFTFSDIYQSLRIVFGTTIR